MRKLIWSVLALVLCCAMVRAGEPGGERRGPGRGERRGRMGGRGGPPGMFGRRDRGTDIFDVARRACELNAEAQAAVGNLAIQYAVEEADVLADLRKRLNKEYLVRVLALLPDDEKAKYEKVVAAMTERDEAIAAAKKELREILDKVRTRQGADKVVADDRGPRFFRPRRGEVPTQKLDMFRTHFVLNEDQRADLENIRDGNREAMREKMRERMGDLRRGGGRPDPARMRQLGQVFRQVRQEVDEENAKAVVQILTDAQKKDFAVATAAMDACKKKAADAEAACRKKVTEVIGEEKTTALLGPPPAAPAKPAPVEKQPDF